MTHRQRHLVVAALAAAAGPLVYMFGMPLWRGLTQSEDESTDFDFTINPSIPWLNGKDADGDVLVLVAMHEWLNNNTAGIGHG